MDIDRTLTFRWIYKQTSESSKPSIVPTFTIIFDNYLATFNSGTADGSVERSTLSINICMLVPKKSVSYLNDVVSRNLCLLDLSFSKDDGRASYSLRGPDTDVLSAEPAPQYFLAFYRELSNQIDAIAKRILGTAYWRFGEFTSPIDFELESAQWESSGGWKKMPFRLQNTLVLKHNMRSQFDHAIGHIVRAAEEKYDEPVYREMLRESRTDERKDSSFAIAVAALEVCVKQTVAALEPENEWLLSNAPSPDILKICKEYLPQLLARKNIKHPGLSEKMLNEMKKAIGIRNTIVHRGGCSLERSRRHEFLTNITEMIYVLESLQGIDWTIHLLSDSTYQAHIE